MTRSPTGPTGWVDDGGVGLTDVEIAAAAHRVDRSRLTAYGRVPGVASRSGPGWTAVRTGADSNDLNGVLSDPGVVVTPALVTELVGWFAEARVPASWLATAAEPALTAALLAAGARAERTGNWSGRSMPAVIEVPTTAIEVVRVRTDRDLDRWLDVAAACEWFDTDQDRQRRRELFRAVGLGPAALRHWLALDGGQPVAFASSYLDQEVVDLCNLGVVESHRRRGIGRALVAVRLAEARAGGALTVVSAPSQDGWRLQQTLGFRTVPVIPDTCFYLPSPGRPSRGPGISDQE